MIIVLLNSQFFERQILCSSMVWTCSITGKTGLTFEEALNSERNAHEMLNAFPNGLQLPVLYLMNYINESKFSSIIDMICAFISNRYFIGEDIEALKSGKK
jgi:bromodomain adjacent to zinc finger domain protein 1A